MPKTGLAKELMRSRKNPNNVPLWGGPCGDTTNSGITASLLSRYFVCGERFRVHVIEGLQAPERFHAPMDFGNMWHECERALSGGANEAKGADWGKFSWEAPLKKHAQGLCAKYPLQQDEISGWYEKCRAMFPLYVKHWAEHPDVKDRVPLFQEQVFDVPYTLPSGRVVRLRGKWDAGDLIGKGKDAGIFLQENKSKSSIDSQKIAQQLTFDLQTQIYVISLVAAREKALSCVGELNKLAFPIRGVRYNVVRRSAHKSVESMLKKIAEDEADGRIGEWFARWKVDILPADVERFKRTCLHPVLENLCDDYEWWSWCRFQNKSPFDATDPLGIRSNHKRQHFIMPHGVYNVLAEHGSTDLDEHIRTGSTIGLVRCENLFPELQ